MKNKETVSIIYCVSGVNDFGIVAVYKTEEDAMKAIKNTIRFEKEDIYSCGFEINGECNDLDGSKSYEIDISTGETIIFGIETREVKTYE